MLASTRLSDHVREILISAIAEADGNEVFAVGMCGESETVTEVTVASRGNQSSVPVIASYAERGDVLIHNHPSGVLTPSSADLDVAGSYAESGVGFYIVDNSVDRIYIVVDPVSRPETVQLDIDALEQHLLPGGSMSKKFPGYELRESQVEMMREVADGFNRGRVVVAEAGTGVGKSVAYLIPAFYWSHLNEERIVVSTATINLQQQLVEKDIPLVRLITGLDIKAELVKGKSNYVCPRRLRECSDENTLFAERDDSVDMIRDWAALTPTGDRTDLPEQVADSVWSRVCAEADGCRGLRCAARGDCFVMSARRRAASARILVTNHHLLFSDLAIRLAGVGRDRTAVLPPFQHIVFDEAHNIEKNATSFFSDRYDQPALSRNLSILHRTRRGTSFGILRRLRPLVPIEDELVKAQLLVDELDECATEVSAQTLAVMTDRTLRLKGSTGLGVLDATKARLIELRVLMLRLIAHLDKIRLSLPEEVSDDAAVIDLSVVAARLDGFSTLLDGILHLSERSDLVFWLERRQTPRGKMIVTYYSTPLDVSGLLRKVFDAYETVVCTSATLSVRDSFDYFTSRAGLASIMAELRCISFPSPFPFHERVMLTLFEDAPEPNHPEYQKYVEQTLSNILAISEGSALVLFTSYSMLEQTYEAVSPGLRKAGIVLLRQGDRDRSRLLSEFSADPSSVLFATDSFWEGVDAPGETLRVVVICRLPFRVPNDPVFEARVEAIDAAGGNAFYELSIPQAVMRLKQGFGRLMRHSTDGGVVAILDSRILSRQYGRLFLDSLPKTVVSIGAQRRVVDQIESFLYPAG